MLPYVTLWLLNVALENNSFIGVFPIQSSIHSGCSMVVLNNQRIYESYVTLHHGFSQYFNIQCSIYTMDVPIKTSIYSGFFSLNHGTSHFSIIFPLKPKWSCSNWLPTAPRRGITRRLSWVDADLARICRHFRHAKGSFDHGRNHGVCDIIFKCSVCIYVYMYMYIYTYVHIDI